MVSPAKNFTPLWLTVGFASGLLFGWFAFHEEKPKIHVAPPLVVKASPEPSPRPADAATLQAVEATFERWGGYAVWEDDRTELAVWNARRKSHADFYEIRREKGLFFFRTLPALSRPLVDHGVSARLPIRFTEPEWMREQFYRENPHYDPATAPEVELPPRPPDRNLPVTSGPRLLTSGVGS